jgi:hypothetical protein
VRTPVGNDANRYWVGVAFYALGGFFAYATLHFATKGGGIPLIHPIIAILCFRLGYKRTRPDPAPLATTRDGRVADCIHRWFPESNWAEVQEILGYVTTGPDVQRAVLSLADGELGMVYHYVEEAQGNYKDVLWWEQMRSREEVRSPAPQLREVCETETKPT